MAFDVGAIVARLTLNTKQFSGSVKEIKQQQDEIKKKAKEASESFKKLGRSMAIAGTAIVGSFALMTKKAIDANETFSKFGVVFRDVIGDANRLTKDLAENYGISAVEASRLVSNTGDLLTGFGFGQKAALGLSEKVNKLAVDLASFTNIEGGASRASEALTKAILGETESAKSLGIVIRQDTKEFRAQVDAIMQAQGTTMQQAKSILILKQATEQSKNAIGDFARTQDSAANQARILQARFQDLIVDIGQKLVPVAQKLIKAAQEIVTKVSDWVKENPRLSATLIKLVVGVGGLLALFGPLLFMLPNIVSGIGLLSNGVGKLTAGLAKGGKGTRGFSQSLGKLPGIMAIATAAIIAQEIAFNALEKAQGRAMARFVKDAKKQKTEMESFMEFKKTANEKEKKWISESLARLQKEGMDRSEATKLVIAELKNRSKAFRELTKERIRQEKEVTTEQKSQLNLQTLSVQTATEDSIKARKKELEENKRIGAELMAGFEALTLFKIEQEEAFDEFMIQQREQRQLLAVNDFQQVLLRLEQEKRAKEQQLRKEFADKQLLSQALLENELTYQAEKKKIIEENNQKATESNKLFWANNKAMAIDSIMAITSIFQNAAQARMNAIDTEYKERKATIEETITDETEKTKALEALEDEFSEKRREVARKAAQADKAAAIVGAVVNTAQAVTKAWAVGGPILGPIFAGIAAAAGFVQIAAIKSQPIPLQEGGITRRETPAIVGDNPSGTEAIIPLERFDEVFGEQGNTFNININAIDGASVKGIFPQLREMIQDATKTENLLISPDAVRSF